MSNKCIREIVGKATQMGLEFTEREAGEMFRKIRQAELRYEKSISGPDGFLKDMEPKKEAAARGQALREKLKTLSPEDRLTEYARIAFEDTVREKQEALRRRLLQIQKNNAIAERIRITNEKTHIKALNEIAFHAEQRKEAILALDMAEMSKALDAYAGKLGYRITRQDALNVVKEIDKPGSTGDANARALAEVWTKGREAARERKNAAGADIGKLKNWIMPQAWDSEGLKTAGLSLSDRAKLHNPLTPAVEKVSIRTKAKTAFVEDAMKHIDRSRYWDDSTGRDLSESELREAIGYAWETIVTDGLNEPVSLQGGSLAKRLGAHREIHFKDADGWYAMAEKYGEKDIFSLMTSTIRRDARDIAVLESYGPNPKAGFDTALALGMSLDQSDKGSWMARNYFVELTGENNIPASNLAANAMLGLRQWLVAAKLGGMLLSQLNDIGTYAAIARTDGLGMGRAVKLMAKSLNPANKRDKVLARRQGILAQSIINDVAQRYGETVKGTGLTSRFASATIKLSGGEWWTNGMKRAYQTLIGAHLNDALKGIEQGPDFKAMLDRYEIGEKELAILKRVEPVDIYGEQVITPTAVRLLGDTPEIKETALKVAMMLGEEADTAVVTPGLKERALLKSGTKPGTAAGEFMRSIALFKTFTVTMTTKVLPRVFGRESLKTARGAGIAAQFALSMIILGGVSYELKEIAKGRNPRDITDPTFWGAAAIQSGGLGIFGDFLFSDRSRFGQGWTDTLLGPVAGMMEDAFKLTAGNIHQAARGEETDAGAESLKFAKDNLPFLNLWYSRAAVDHLVFYQLQEAANPGYLRRMRKRVERENNQGFWWSPEDTLPSGPPALDELAGGR